MKVTESKSPACKRLVATLNPNCILPVSSDDFEFKYCSFTISIKTHGMQTVLVTSDDEVEAEQLWSAFLAIHTLQAFGIGYFYQIDTIEFSNSITGGEEALEQYAGFCRKHLLTYYTSSKDFKGVSLSLVVNENLNQLLCATVVNKFNHLYEKLTIIFTGFWYQSADTRLTVDLRTAFIIQCFQHLGSHIDSDSKKSLGASLTYVFENYPLPCLFENSTANQKLDKFVKMLVDTRNRIMHFDIYANENHILNGAECAYYARVLHIYFRYVVLNLLDVDTAIMANRRIEQWLHKTNECEGRYGSVN